jgi:hypothetical protein
MSVSAFGLSDCSRQYKSLVHGLGGALHSRVIREYLYFCCSRESLITPDAQHGPGCFQQSVIIERCVAGRQSVQAGDHFPPAHNLVSDL